MKVIETVYKWYRFRSRLEARWAVFFDALGVKWEYEKEGYDLELAGRYLPDFWLPDWKMWIEVKGTNPNEDEVRKAFALMMQGQHPVCIVFNFDHCLLFNSRSEKQGCWVDRPIVFLRPFPSEHKKIVDEQLAVAREIDALDKSDPLRDEWIAILHDLEQKRRELIYAFRAQHPPMLTEDDNWHRAVFAARQARFEHGETPGNFVNHR